MKQLLELVIQDDGTLDLKCHNEELANKVLSKKPKVYEKQLKSMISKMVKIMWGDKNTGMSKLIRFLSRLRFAPVQSHILRRKNSGL